MREKLFILLGEYNLVRPLVHEIFQSTEGLFYTHSLLAEFSNLKQYNDSPEALYSSVLDNEIQRDAKILRLLEDGSNVIAENWHFGNLALARIYAPKIAGEYYGKIQDHLHNFRDIDIKLLYISSDIDKLVLDSKIDTKRKELQELSSLLLEWGYDIETIDGDALPKKIRERLANLLGINI